MALPLTNGTQLLAGIIEPLPHNHNLYSLCSGPNSTIVLFADHFIREDLSEGAVEPNERGLPAGYS